jgi:hypothetical protein
VTGNTVTDSLYDGLGSGASAFVNNSSGCVATVSDNHWPPTASEGPYGGTPAAVTGMVQAESCDTGGGYDLGWTSGGQWLRYTVDVATAGTPTLGLRVAAPSAVAGALHLSDASPTGAPEPRP